MSAVVERAFAVAAEHGYGGPESRALFQMALDADHETGENCVTSRARLQKAAGYRDDGGTYRSATRALRRFIADGVVRVDVEVSGIGRLFTVCPIAPWSGDISTSTTVGRKLATRLRRQRTPDTQASRGDTQASRGDDATPDTTPDTQASTDQKTNYRTADDDDRGHAHNREQGEPDTPALRLLAALAERHDRPFEVDAARELLDAHPPVRGEQVARHLSAVYADQPVTDVVGVLRSTIERWRDGGRRNGAAARRGQQAPAAAVTGTVPAAEAEAAAKAIEPATDDAVAAWERVRAEMRRAVSEAMWQLWLEPLALLGTAAGGVLVIGVSAESRGWITSSFARLIAKCFESVGATGRLATVAEMQGVQGVEAADAVVAS